VLVTHIKAYNRPVIEHVFSVTLWQQELCREWNKKPKSDKQFEPFYKAISAVAFSSGVKLKTRAAVFGRV